MAIIVEALGGRSGSLDSSKASHTLLFDAWDTGTRWPAIDALYSAVLSTAPLTFQDVGITTINWDEDTENGHTVFSITYSSDEPLESLLKVSFDTTGGTVRARASRSTTSYAISGRTAPDFKGSIEVSDGEPQGVDVAIPALKLVFTYKWPKGVVTLNDVKAIAGFTGKTNSAPWYGYQAGELLFLGASGQLDLTVPTEIAYNFAASANATVSIGSWITGIQKGGHQHLWVAFEDTEDSAAKKLVQRPLGAYVETLYDSADFAAFGIGS
jgi:hypothetical protein